MPEGVKNQRVIIIIISRSAGVHDIVNQFSHDRNVAPPGVSNDVRYTIRHTECTSGGMYHYVCFHQLCNKSSFCLLSYYSAV